MNVTLSDDPAPLRGTVIDEATLLTLTDLSHMCSIEETRLVQFVEEGVVTVHESAGRSWRFTCEAVRRTQLAVRLERDLQLDLAAVALAVDLLEEIHRLRRELNRRDHGAA